MVQNLVQVNGTAYAAVRRFLDMGYTFLKPSPSNVIDVAEALAVLAQRIDPKCVSLRFPELAATLLIRSLLIVD